MNWNDLTHWSMPINNAIITFLVPVLVKYSVNIINWLEDLQKKDFSNWSKQAAVVIFSYISTQLPFLKSYLPSIDPVLQTALLSVMTTLTHHVIELLVNLEKGTSPPNQIGQIGDKK